jgi:hypothetical protein
LNSQTGTLSIDAENRNANNNKSESKGPPVVTQPPPPITEEGQQLVDLAVGVRRKFTDLENAWKENKGQPTGNEAVNEAKGILSRLHVQVSPTATPEQIFDSLNAEIVKVGTDLNYLPKMRIKINKK